MPLRLDECPNCGQLVLPGMTELTRPWEPMLVEYAQCGSCGIIWVL